MKKIVFGALIILGLLIRPLGRLLQEMWAAYEKITIDPDRLL